ncbi:MAG: T9SS type A sorting domain-containing protein [Bacteroidota bacterium]
MAKILQFIVLASIAILFPVSSVYACSDAGTASATQLNICNNSSTTLQLTNYLGAIQWQVFSGGSWTNATGTGSTTDSYQVSPIQTTDYRAVVTAIGCAPDTSNIITITVGVAPPVGTGATRCGYGSVTLNATGNGIKWFASATGGTALGTGSSFTTNVANTTTFYAASTVGGGPPTPLTTTFQAGNGFDGNMFDITAINTITIDSIAGNFNVGSGTAEVWYRVGSYQGFTGSNAGWIQAGTAAYTSTGNGAPGTTINANLNITIPAGQTYGIYVHASGGVQYTNGTTVGNLYVSDANIQVFEGHGGAYFNLVNQPRIFNGRIMYSAGCESARTPVVATVNTAPSISISANPPSLCQGQTSTISVSSSNSQYTYSWSPSTSLSASTGSTVTANPSSPITYTVIANDGICGNIDSVFIDVGPASVAGTAVISTDTICLGSNATLFLTGNTGNIQWQSNTGSGWVNESGAGSNAAQYLVSPTTNIQYRAIVTCGGCASATTGTLQLTVLAVTDPITTNDTICGAGAVNLAATGQGVLSWYTSPTAGNSVNTGPSYSPNILSTTTFYVEAAAGGTYNVGPASSSIGTQFTVSSNDWGMSFDVTQQVSLDRVYISPGGTSGPITINLRATSGGPILNTVTANVIAFSGLQPITLGWTINPGTGYRLELATGSVPLYYNSFGATYPYTFPGSSVSITGYFNPNQASGSFYYFFYNWQITEGCKSNRVPVTGVVNSVPSVPIINTNGTVLSSSSATGNQWFLNGIVIPGATGQSHNMNLTGAGTYTVSVTNSSGCSAVSLPYLYSSLSEGFQAIGVSAYPIPASNVLHIDLPENILREVKSVHIKSITGSKVAEFGISEVKNSLDLSNIVGGSYMMELHTNSGIYTEKLVITKR